MEFLEILAPLLIPFIVGALGTLVASTFITSKRLRTELQQESEMLDRLPLAARKELRKDVERRALLLVSINRFPPITRVDLIALVIAVLSIATGFYMARSIVLNPVEPPAIQLVAFSLPLYAAIALVIFFKDWQMRALRRIRWVHKNLGAEEPKPIARMVLVGYVAGLLTSMTVVASLFATVAGTWLYANGSLSRDHALYGGFAFVVLAVLPVATLMRTSRLAMEIGTTLSVSHHPLWSKPSAKFKAERRVSMANL